MPSLTSKEIVSKAFLMRMRHKRKTFIMVEGETDRALWVKYMADCELFPTKGKDVIIDAVKNPILRDLPGIAAIVDADYWLITQSAVCIENLLYDGCCPDMESILLNSPALKKVLRHTFSKYEIEQIHEFAEKLKKEALRLAAEFGYFRLLNHENNYSINFKAYRLEDFIDKSKGALGLDQKWAARRLAEDKKWISSEELLKEVDKLRERYLPDNIQLCRGKDVLEIMTVILPILFESEFGEDLPDNENDICRKQLTEEYEYKYFTETSLFNRIRKWESDNSPYRIIRREG